MDLSPADQRLFAKLDVWYGGRLQANLPEWARAVEPEPADLGLQDDDDLMGEALLEGWMVKLQRFHYLRQEEALTHPWSRKPPDRS
jgi:hypothetical protein